MKSIHLLGIGGIGMVALAGLLKARGFEITGTEATPPYPPASKVLKDLGIEPILGFREENIDLVKPSAVVVGNVIRADNPEVKRARKLGLPLHSMPSALAEWILPDKKSLVVAGTHGKTTTTALLAHTLETLSTEPTYLVGGILRSSGLNFRYGNGPFVVLEGDEYDSAFFDKSPKFWHYRPWAAILTGVEYDHADIYPDYGSLLSAFRRFVALIPREGVLVFCGDDPGAREAVLESSCRLISYGKDSGNDYVLEAFEPQSSGSTMRVKTPETRFQMKIPLFGEHNALNALAVMALLLELGFSIEDTAQALSAFQGVLRRQEVLYRGKVTVIDDFAHHPTAVRVTLSALREALRPVRLFVCFEPRTNTSKRGIFMTEYAKSLALADRVFIKEPPGLDRIPEEERLDLRALANELNNRGVLTSIETGIHLGERLAEELRAGDLIVFMSSASFGEVYSELIEYLKDRGL